MTNDKFPDRNVLKRFARNFIEERTDSLKKDVSHCLKGDATFPALLYCMSTIYLLGELNSVDSKSDTTTNSITYMQDLMGYTKVQTDLVMKLFRHKLVHLAQPRPIAVYPEDSANVVTWQYIHSDSKMHLILEELPPKTKIQIMPGWEIEVNQRFSIGIWQLVEDINNSVYRQGGFLDKLEQSQDLQTNMNRASLAIVAGILVAAAAIGFLTTQSAAAQFNTDNSASQSSTETGDAAGGAGGSASVDQGVCQQIGQTGAFGSSSNTISGSDCS